jgi:hypothetical protein
VPDGFVTLAVLVRGPATPPDPEPLERAEPNVAPPQPPAPLPPAILCELARLRLAAAEAYERGAAALLASLARDVLARELLLAPADLAALVATAPATCGAREPVTLVVSSADAASLADRTPLPVRIDPALGAGDLVVEVRDGAYASPLRFRLERVLAEVGA